MSRRSISIKSHFTTSEDSLLTDIITKNPKKSWEKLTELFNDKIMSRCNSYLQMRTERQIKERWMNYLSPSINRDPWTEAEDSLLLEKFNEIGPKWVTIAKLFNGRTDISLKNRYRTLSIKKKETKVKREIKEEEEEMIAFPISQLFEMPPLTSEIQDEILESTKAFLDIGDNSYDPFVTSGMHSF